MMQDTAPHLNSDLSSNLNSNLSSDLSSDEILKRVKSPRYPWHQPIQITPALNTRKNAIRRFERRLKLMQVPMDLTGKTILDIGAWDGYFSFEFERRGAKRVLAIDTYAWDMGGIDNFLTAREVLKSKVEYRRADVHDLNEVDFGKFDIVFFAGVLYHLKNPLVALERIRSVTNELLICETHAMIPFMHEKYPIISFFPGDENTTERWKICAYPTLSWLKHALQSAGFAKHEFKYTPSMRLWRKLKALFTNTPQSGRCIVHAFVK